MKAVRLVAAHHPLELHELSRPTLGDNAVLVHARAAGLCPLKLGYTSALGITSQWWKRIWCWRIWHNG